MNQRFTTVLACAHSFGRHSRNVFDSRCRASDAMLQPSRASSARTPQLSAAHMRTRANVHVADPTSMSPCSRNPRRTHRTSSIFFAASPFCQRISKTAQYCASRRTLVAGQCHCEGGHLRPSRCKCMGRASCRANAKP
jgi:hypothetical protein